MVWHTVFHTTQCAFLQLPRELYIGSTSLMSKHMIMAGSQSQTVDGTGNTSSCHYSLLAAVQSIACAHTQQHLLHKTYEPNRNCNTVLRVQKVSSRGHFKKGIAPCLCLADYCSQEQSHTTCSHHRSQWSSPYEPN